MKKYYLSIIVLLSFSLYSFSAKIEYSSNIQKAHLKILEYRFEEAKLILNTETLRKPDNLYIPYLICYQEFIKAYFNNNQKNYEQFTNSTKSIIDKLKPINSNQSNTLIANIYVFEGFIHFLRDEKFNYAKAIFKGNKYINKVDDCFYEKKKIKSLYEVLGYSVPEKYKSFANFFDLGGSALKGLKMINDFLKKEKLSKAQEIEGQIFQMYLHHFLDIPLKKQELNYHSQLLLYVYLQTSSLNAKDKINLINQYAKKSIGYFKYLKGKLLIQMQKKEGYSLLEEYTKNKLTNTFKHDALYQMYAYNIVNNKPFLAEQCKSKISDLEEAIFPIDKNAQKRLSKNRPKFLIKAEQLFDAGMYRESLSLLSKDKNKSYLETTQQKIEFTYRKARNYEMLKQYNKAINLYNIVIKSHFKEIYFIPFSAYRCAKIYKNKKNYSEAEHYCNKTFELNNGEFQHSMNLKTRFALDMIKNKSD